MILTDIVLRGDMRGLAFVKYIRQINGKRGNIPILAVTAFEDDSRKLELLRSGVSDILFKPINPEELTIRVNNLVASKLVLDELDHKQYQLERMALSDQLTRLYNLNLVSLSDLNYKGIFI